MYNTIDAEVDSKGIVSIRDALIKKQQQNEKVFRLESGDPSFSIFSHVKEAIEKALRNGHTHYTAGAGISKLREVLADKLRNKNNIKIENMNEVFVTNGAMNGLYVVLQSIIENGDEVIVQDPSWTETIDITKLSGGKPIRLKTFEDIESFITNKTKVVIINSPHNPTGEIIEEKTLKHILNVCDKYNLTLLSDEAYEDIIFDERKHISPASLKYENVISVFSFSKSYAMSGLRLGYVSTNNKSYMDRISKYLRCTINGVNSATQYGGIAAIEGPQEEINKMRNIYQARRDLLYEALKKNKNNVFEPSYPKGAFYMWCKLSDDCDGWNMTNELINKCGVGSAPGEVFSPNFKNYIRFSFACETQQIIEASMKLREFEKE